VVIKKSTTEWSLGAVREQDVSFRVAQAGDDSIPLHLIRWREIEVTHTRIIVRVAPLSSAAHREFRPQE
jgi:hypothetical protein